MSNGIIKVPPSILQKPSSQPNTGNASKSATKRPTQARSKVIVRRLSPGLTEAEFGLALGAEWKLGAGKVDWFVYRHGKVSKDLAKPSRPARAYVHFTDASHVAAFSEKVRATQFQDAKNSSRDAALLGPPVVEFAPYTRIPTFRKRKDARQGTIDQDPDFIVFLESLTNPIVKPAGDLEPTPKPERWTTTPLIEHIREKKARKDKPSASKSAQRDAKDAAKAKPSKDAPPSPSPDKSKKQVKATVAAKEAVKVLNRQAVTVSSTSATSQTTEKLKTAPAVSEKSQLERRRERPAAPVNMLAAKIRGDLGIGGTTRRARGQKPTETTTTLPGPKTSSKEESATPAPAPATAPKREPRGRDRRNSKPPRPEASKTEATGSPTPAQPANPPTILRKPAVQSSAPSKQPQPTSSKSSDTTAGHRAFLKHANESQGITEPLIKTALSAYGPVLKVEIDKRKGIAFADFSTAEGLSAAVSKGKVEVGSGAVVVSRYRERPTRGGGIVAPAAPISAANGSVAGPASTAPVIRSAEGLAGRGRGSRGRGGRGRGQSNVTSVPGAAVTTATPAQTSAAAAPTNASNG